MCFSLLLALVHPQTASEQRVPLVRESCTTMYHQCKLGRRYISSSSTICADKYLKTEVAKLQIGMRNQLTEEKLRALSCLRRTDASVNPKPQIPSKSAIQARLGKQRWKRLRSH